MQHSVVFVHIQRTFNFSNRFHGFECLHLNASQLGPHSVQDFCDTIIFLFHKFILLVLVVGLLESERARTKASIAGGGGGFGAQV